MHQPSRPHFTRPTLARRWKCPRLARHHRRVVIRWTVVVLAVGLSILLIVSGYPLIGSPIMVLALARAVILVRSHRNPQRHGRRYHGYSDPG
jgi:hypothetical protein